MGRAGSVALSFLRAAKKERHCDNATIEWEKQRIFNCINRGTIMGHNETIAIEENILISFCKKIPLSVEYGKGVRVWDENGSELNYQRNIMI